MVKKVIVGLAAVWLILLSIFAVASFMKGKDEEPVVEEPVVSNPSVSDLLDGAAAEGIQIDVDHIVGSWMSDRTDQNMMTLNQDYTFEDTNLMGSGTYEIRGSYIVLTAKSGSSYVLLYREDMDEFYYTIDKYVSVYHRATEEEISEKKARIENRLSEQAEKAIECAKEAKERLENTSWGSGTDYVAFKSHSFIRHKGDMEQEYNFEIADASYIEGYPTGYSLNLSVTDIDGNPQECEFFMLLDGNEELPQSIEFSLNGETITLPNAYQSEIDWGDEAEDEPETPVDQTEPVGDQDEPATEEIEPTSENN